MIRAVADGAGVRLECELASGAVAYVDADWIVGGAAVPALVAERSTLRWGDEEPAVTELEGDPDSAAGRALAGVASEALAALGDGGAAVEVLGRGAIAARIRTELGTRLAAGSEHPSAVVDLTGDPDAIRLATERIAPLGTVVLAGEPAGRRLALDLYPDVHARGLRIVGVGRPLSSPPDAAGVGPPTRLAPGEPIDPGAGGWFAVAASPS